MRPLLYLFIAYNVFVCFLYGFDKLLAIKHKNRIPEPLLLLPVFFFGAVGGFMGMHIFHHKVRKPVFAIGVPLFILLNLGMIYYFYTKGIL